MDLWEQTKELNICFEGERSKMENVEYRLYEPNLITAMRYIFQLDLKRNEDKNGEDGKFQSQQRKKCNILALIGARGAGKTTAMGELCSILRKMSEDSVKDQWVENVVDSEKDQKCLWKRSFCFHVLNPADASLLENKDDLFELILAGLYEEYEKKLRQCNSSGSIRINRLFSELLELYRSSSEAGREYQEDYTVYTVKRMLRGSSQIVEKVGDIIDEVCRPNLERCREYFVIAIDDLDLNLSHGYLMLEQLQKYFADPRILILVTMDYDQMWRVCAEYFHQNMPTTDLIDEKIGSGLHSHQLANDLMTKIFPLQQRLFLPDMKKQGNRMLIHIGKEKDIHIKNLIMEKVAERMRIFYDAKGSKKHFCEPDTIRKLVDYNDFLNSLLPVDFKSLVPVECLKDEDEKQAQENEKQLRKYDHNHNRFNWDIMERQAQTTLDVWQHSIFRQLLDCPLERRMVCFVKTVNSAKEGTVRLVDVSKEDCSQYAYGDCLEVIYKWGRAEYANKPLISCVLASFTSEMVREYVNYRYLKEPVRRARSRERLKAFLGNSFSNRWVMERIFPTVINLVNREEIPAFFGYDKGVSIGDIVYYIGDLKCLEKGKNKGKIRKEDICAWLDQTGIVETLECVDMFLCVGAEDDYSGPRPLFELAGSRFGIEEDETKIRKYIRVEYTDKNVLDIMGFVGKSLNYQLHRDKLCEWISEELNSVFKEYFNEAGKAYDENGMKEAIESAVGDHSIFKRYWDGELSSEAALPFYELDFMYNVIKRIQKGKQESVRREKIYDGMLELYGDIETALEEQEAVYEFAKMDYSGTFRACPYIRALRGFREEGRNEIIDQITSAVYATSHYNDLWRSRPEEPRD